MAHAVLMHLAVSTLSAMGMGLVAGRLNPFISFVSLGLGLAVAVLTWWRMKDERALFPGLTLAEGLFYSFILFAGFQHFLYLLYYGSNGLKTLHLNNYGDLSMHIQYIRHFAGSGRFWPDNPEFAGALLTYPLGIDLYNALWESVGVPLESHLFMTGVIMTVATVSMLHRWAGWFGVGAFFLNGGLANWQSLKTRILFDFQNMAAWKNFFLSLWITQRGFLFALPAGVYVLKTVLEVLTEDRALRREEKVLCAVLWSGLAWFHLHTFFIISLVLGICMLFSRKFRPVAGIIVPVAVAGLVFVSFSTKGFSKASIVHLQWGWVAGKENLSSFWLRNLGLWLLLLPAAGFGLSKKTFARLRPVAAVSFLLFIFFTWVMVAPWDWDNIKVLLWLYLIIVWVVWRTWMHSLSPIIAFFIGCALFLPGTISVLSSLPGNSRGVQLYQATEIWEAKSALMDLPEGYVLATAPDPNHPAMYWGARVAVGYTGHLWSHGIQHAERDRKLHEIFKGSPDWRAFSRDIGATHIYWGPNEQRRYAKYQAPWRSELKNVSRSPAVEVYEVGAHAAGAGKQQ